MSYAENDIARVLFEEDKINQRVAALAKELSSDYKEAPPVMICVLKGAAIFFSDLIRKMDIPLEVDYMRVSSYKTSTVSTGQLEILSDIKSVIARRDVLLVDDIMDTGYTLFNLVDNLSQREPNSIKLLTLLDKPSRRKAPIAPDYVGFQVPNEFIVGYGLDYSEMYRNLPFIASLKKSVYAG